MGGFQCHLAWFAHIILLARSRARYQPEKGRSAFQWNGYRQIPIGPGWNNPRSRPSRARHQGTQYLRLPRGRQCRPRQRQRAGGHGAGHNGGRNAFGNEGYHPLDGAHLGSICESRTAKSQLTTPLDRVVCEEKCSRNRIDRGGKVAGERLSADTGKSLGNQSRTDQAGAPIIDHSGELIGDEMKRYLTLGQWLPGRCRRGQAALGTQSSDVHGQ